ncbi:helix-turn-helix domain-containing protein [Stenotrophomonas muris]|jgi:DNA invertase Pin-like site-specific DNA recombinase|nr:helix-turn-helix domain-containing protein [Stenotrophomonas muris]
MFNMVGAFAEFERGLIRERTLLGLERARRRGSRLGRPKVGPTTERQIVALLEAKTPVNRIVRQTGVGVSVVYRIKKAMAA